MALDWMRRSWEAADADEFSFVAGTASELARIVYGLHEASRGHAVAQAFKLHKRQGLAVRKATARMLSMHSQAVVDLTLPPTSLLRMSVAELSGVSFVSLVERGPVEPSITLAPAGAVQIASTDLLPLQVVFTHDRRGPLVDVRQLDTLTGKSAALVHALKVPFDEDRANEKPRKLHRYVPSFQLDDRSGPAVKMTVQRLRRQLASAYHTLEGRPPDAHLLVQSKRNGFRLDPSIHPVAQGGSEA